MYICMYVYIYIYIYIYTHEYKQSTGLPGLSFGKGQMGSALIGSLLISCFLTEGLFGCSR